MAAQTLPPEMGTAWTNLSFQQKASEGGTLAVFGMSLVFVFLILAALYESWSLPVQRAPGDAAGGARARSSG